jgi:hypothetical protein
MDAGKQVISQGVAHIMNVVIAYLMSEWDSENQCVWYFINLMIDCTLGVLFAYLLLKAATAAALKCGLERLRTGEYLLMSDKPDFKAWGMQLGMWCLVVLIVKWSLVGLIFVLRNFLSTIGVFVLSPVESDPQLELVVVMVFVPCLMNIIQFWVQDNFLKGKTKPNPEKMMLDMSSTVESLDVIN